MIDEEIELIGDEVEIVGEIKFETECRWYDWRFMMKILPVTKLELHLPTRHIMSLEKESN